MGHVKSAYFDIVESDGCNLNVPSEDLVCNLSDRLGCNTLQDRRGFRYIKCRLL